MVQFSNKNVSFYLFYRLFAIFYKNIIAMLFSNVV